MAPVQRRPISSLARWNRPHSSGTTRDAGGRFGRRFRLDTPFIYKV
jgi:hypothetical protein